MDFGVFKLLLGGVRFSHGFCGFDKYIKYKYARLRKSKKYMGEGWNREKRVFLDK